MKWRDYDWGECGNCGHNDLETLTNCDPGYCRDGDVIRCKTCGELGSINCDPETPPFELWNGRDGLEVELQLGRDAAEGKD